jgi:hypothetical protein
MSVFGGELQEVLHQDEDIFAALPQRRHSDIDDVQAVVEILSKQLLGDLLGQRAVGRGDDPIVDPRGVVGADTLKLACFQKPQQQSLHAEAHLADFVHEDCAAVRSLQPARLVRVRVGEAPLHVPE